MKPVPPPISHAAGDLSKHVLTPATSLPLNAVTALPNHIFIRVDSSEGSFVSRTCAASMVLLCDLIFMHAITNYKRSKSECRW